MGETQGNSVTSKREYEDCDRDIAEKSYSCEGMGTRGIASLPSHETVTLQKH